MKARDLVGMRWESKATKDYEEGFFHGKVVEAIGENYIIFTYGTGKRQKLEVDIFLKRNNVYKPEEKTIFISLPI